MSKSSLMGLIVGVVLSWCVWMLATAEAVVVPSTTTTTTEVVVTTTTQVVRPVPTTTTTSTTTTTTLPVVVTDVAYECPHVVRIAYSVGWPLDELDTLSRIAHRESRCNPAAHNATDPNGGSFGLMQLNGFWCNSASSFLQENGVVTKCEDLWSPRINLEAALLIWQRSGWAPWGG